MDAAALDAAGGIAKSSPEGGGMNGGSCAKGGNDGMDSSSDSADG